MLFIVLYCLWDYLFDFLVKKQSKVNSLVGCGTQKFDHIDISSQGYLGKKHLVKLFIRTYDV